MTMKAAAWTRQLALGVNLRGDKELLGLWIEQNEGAKFWLHVLTELKNRGVAPAATACRAFRRP